MKIVILAVSTPVRYGIDCRLDFLAVRICVQSEFEEPDIVTGDSYPVFFTAIISTLDGAVFRYVEIGIEFVCETEIFTCRGSVGVHVDAVVPVGAV